MRKPLLFVLRFLRGLVLAALALTLVYLLYSLIAYRDIPAEQLEAQYGGPHLSTLEIDGTRLAYRLEGRPLGEAPVLLLIHSHYFNSRMWDSWVDLLGDEFSILRFDMTSHGLTGPDANNDYSMARDLKLTDALVNHLKIQRLALVGSSLGGNQAFQYAAAHQEKVSHLVLINSGGLKREQSSRRNAQAIPPWFYRVFYLVPEVAYRFFIEWMVADPAAISDSFVEEFHDMFRRAGNRKAEMERMRNFDVGEPGPVLAAVRAPTLILWGRENPQLPISHVTRFETALSNAERVTSQLFPGAGHLLPVELPEASALATRDFILGAQ